MNLKTNTVKISGVPNDNGWSQSFEYTLGDNQDKNTSLLAIVFSTLGKNTEYDDAIIGRELLNRFREEYFSIKDQDADNSLKYSVKKIFEEFFQKLDGLEIAAACLSGNNLYAASINGGKVSLYRDNFLVKILDSNAPQLVSASGFPKENDIMVLATSDFHKNMTFMEMKDVFSRSLDEVKDYFSMKLHDVSTASVALIKFERSTANESIRQTTPIDITDSDVKNTPTKREAHPRVFRNIFNKFNSIMPRKRIYLHQEEIKTLEVKSKKMMYLGFFLTLLLVVSVFFGIIKNKRDTYRSSYLATLNDARSNIEDAINLKDVDVVRSRESFLKGKELLLKLKEDQIKDPEIAVLDALVMENGDEILGEIKADSEMWLDLTLIIDGFTSDLVVGSEGELFVFDPNLSRVISVDMTTKKSRTIRVDDIKNGIGFNVQNDEIYILTEDGIYENTSGDKVIDKNWEEAKYISSYASNIYILDGQKGEILKSAVTDSGYSDAKKWTTSDSENFNDSRSFVIDGFVWVLNDSGVRKYSYGNKIRYELKGYPYSLPKYDGLYTNEETENLYLLSKETKVISVFNKEGDYRYNLMSDIVSEAESIVLSDDGEKIFLLTGKKLYTIPAKR